MPSVLGNTGRIPAPAPVFTPPAVVRDRPSSVLGNSVLGQPAMPAPQPVDDDQRDFTDVFKARRNVYDSVLNSFNKIGQIKNTRYTLELLNPEYVDPEDVPLQKQKEAILTGKSLHRRVRGTWRLSDSVTGNLIDEKQQTIAQVPYMTPRGTFVINGTEYTISNQMRLRPGVFTRVKENGEIESHVNVMPGNGISHRYFLDPESGVFKISIGQAKLPLLPVLRALGVKDTELRKAWGDELVNANLQAPDGKTINKLYQRLVRRANPDASDEEKAKSISDLLTSMRMDPEVTKRTLGHPHEFLTKEAILDTTKKLVSVARKEAEPDDRDHLAFQTLYGAEDLLSERITKDKSFLRNLLFKITTRGNLSGMQPGALTRQLQATLLHTGLGQAAEEINPAELLDALSRVTRLGEGGIGSIDAVPDEARSVQPSHFCYDDETMVLTSAGWLPWREVTTEHELATVDEDWRPVYEKPTAVLHEQYSGEMIGLDSKMLNYLVTPNHRMYVSTNKKPDVWYIEDASEVFGKRRRHWRKFGLYEQTGAQTYTIAEPEHNYAHRGMLPYGDIVVDMEDWCEFLGWYLSEGSVTIRTGKNTAYTTHISQSIKANPEKCKQIEALLTKLPFNFYYSAANLAFHIDSKHLAFEVAVFGKAQDKHIPRYVFKQSVAARRRMLEALMLGDGSAKEGRYVTTSWQLALDVHELATSLGHVAAIYPMDSPSHLANPAHKQRWRVNISRTDKEVVTVREQNQYDRGLKERGHYKTQYDGMIHCAQVRSGLLYVMRNGCAFWSGNSYIDPIRTPESFKVGVDTRFSYAARKGKDNRIYSPFKDIKTGQTVYKSPQDVTDAVVAFPGELAKGEPFVASMVNGQMKFVPREQVQYEMPHMENSFSPLANMIPMKSALKGQRMAMGSRYLAQALPLVEREAPLVQGAMPGMHLNKSFEDNYGTYMGAIRAKQGGYVQKVNPDSLVVKYDDGTKDTIELYNNFPFSRKTFINNEPLLKSGQRFEQDQLLAKSNYTDDNGTAALGLNARIAFIPFKGANYEDAAVISESFAKRMSSEHMYQKDQDWSDNIAKGTKKFISLFPTAYDKRQLANMDEQGVVKPGTVLKFGDPMVLVAESRERTHSQIHRGRKPSYSNNTITWDHHADGIVTDVAHTNKGVAVAVKSVNQMQVGDKLSNRYGGKGVISMIVSDDEMPKDAEGRPFEVALNPLGMISRINPAQIAETVLAKIARKTGKPYKIEDFSSVGDLVEFTKKEAEKYGISDLETLNDPETGRPIPNVLTGEQFLLKLHHTSESKGQGRGIGGYTAEEVPAKGGADGSKRIALLETNALLSHGATEFLRDAHLVRGQKNDAYWTAFMSGYRPPDPEVPLVYKKFVDSLKASGINVVRNGRQLHVMAMTDNDVNQLTGDRFITNTDTVDWKEGLKPKRGGLFDPTLTGGHGGNRWAAIKLQEPMPNPAFEEPIRRMLGLTEDKFLGVLAGKESVGGFGTGPKAIKDALANINVDKAIQLAEAEMKGSKKGARDEAVRKLAFLKSTKRLNIHPKDWMLSSVPVLPPIYRPVSVMKGNGNPLVADPNYLYKELFDANDALGELSGKVSDVSEERLNVYNAFKGVVGLGDPIQPKNQERQVKGLLKHVFGSSPKLGVVQRQLLGATVEMVGRAVITPNPDFDMDQVGLPEAKAWDVYKPFIIRRLVQKGVPRLEAARAYKDQLPIARDALVNEMANRPVVISRAPVLHRYGIMAFWPRLVKGDVMQIPPLITKGFNADFDGDTMNYHVPATDEAREEAINKLLPSRNLLSASDFKVHYTPSQEYQGGLYHASTAKDDKRRPVIFRNAEDARKAYQEGRINIDTPIEIIES